MGRILFWVVLALAAYALWRGWQRAQRRARMTTERRAAVAGESMVACRVCGLNVPRSEAVADGEHSYCCEEHRRQAHSGG
ncbi:MAG: PP0621 family protein [Betaproteobacteria bacterium]